MEFSTGNMRKAPPRHDLDEDDDKQARNHKTVHLTCRKIWPWDLREWGLTDFRALVDNAEIVPALEKKSFANPLPIQFDAIWHMKEGNDLLVRAKRGSGKTYSYLITVLDWYAGYDNIIAGCTTFLIVSPTDADCKYVYERFTELTSLIRSAKPRVALLTSDRTHKMEPCEILISSPDCVLSAIESGVLRLSKYVSLIFDQIDVLLDHGYDSVLQAIIKKAPEKFKFRAFSDNTSFDVKRHRNIIPRNPYVLTLQDDNSVKWEILPCNVKQFYIACAPQYKLFQVFNLCTQTGSAAYVVVFTRTADMHDEVKLSIEVSRHFTGFPEQFVSVRALESYPPYRSDDSSESDDTSSSPVGARDKLKAEVIFFDVPPNADEYFRGIDCCSGELYTLVSSEEKDIFGDVIAAVEDELGDSSFVVEKSPEKPHKFSGEAAMSKMVREADSARRRRLMELISRKRR